MPAKLVLDLIGERASGMLCYKSVQVGTCVFWVTGLKIFT